MVSNVNVNIDLCFTLSCELVGWLTILGYPVNLSGGWLLPHLKLLEIVYRVGGRWREKCQLWRCRNQGWGARVRTHQKDVLAQWYVEVASEGKTQHHWVLPWYNCVLRLESSLLTNQITIYTSLTYAKPYQNILEFFWTNLKFWWFWLTDQSY